jgi:S1-C subfamily serine protease
VASSPAGAAGLRPRDIIVAIDGRPVKDVSELQALLAERYIGRTVVIGYVRDGRFGTCEATLVELPSS